MQQDLEMDAMIGTFFIGLKGKRKESYHFSGPPILTPSLHVLHPCTRMLGYVVCSTYCCNLFRNGAAPRMAWRLLAGLSAARSFDLGQGAVPVKGHPRGTGVARSTSSVKRLIQEDQAG